MIMRRLILATLMLAILDLWPMTMKAQEELPELNLKMGRPTDAEMQMTRYAPEPGADAVMLMQTCDVVYGVLSSYHLTQRYEVAMRIKVLTEEGCRWSQLAVPYTFNIRNQELCETFDAFTAIAYNLNEKGKLTSAKATPAMIEDQRIDENQMVRRVSVPEVRVGTVIELRYSMGSPRFYHIYNYDLQHEIPVRYTRFHAEIPAMVIFNVDAPVNHPNVKCQVTAGRMEIASTNNLRQKFCPTNCYDIVGQQMPALTAADPYLWNPQDYAARVVFDLKATDFPDARYKYGNSSWEQYGEMTDLKSTDPTQTNQMGRSSETWDDVDALLMEQPEIGGRLDDKSRLDDEVAQAGIAQLPTDKEKVAALVTLLNQHVTWDGKRSLLARSQASVLKEGSGSSADMNMMLANMLNGLGMKPRLVMMSTRRHGRLPLHPSAKALNTFVVAVETADGTLYADAADPMGGPGVLDPNLYVEKARVMDAKGKGSWTDLAKLANARHATHVSATLAADGRITGELKETSIGNAARDKRVAFCEAKDSIQYVRKLQDRHGALITSLTMEGIHAYGTEVVERMTFESEATVTDGRISLRPFAMLTLPDSPFAAETRNMPLELPYRINETFGYELMLPDGYEVEELPHSQEVSNADKTITARLTCSSQTGSVLVSFRLNVKDLVFPAQRYADAKTAYDMALLHLNDRIVVRRKD